MENALDVYKRPYDEKYPVICMDANDIDKYIYALDISDFATSVSMKNAESQLPIKLQLYQNYPNPFNPATTIEYAIPINENVILKVFDVLVREVATLVNEQKPAGTYHATFNATKLPSGVYLYQLRIGNYNETKKMLLLR